VNRPYQIMLFHIILYIFMHCFLIYNVQLYT